MPTLTIKDVERFWKKVAVKGPNDCWEWKAGRSKQGYGVFSVKHKWIAAHVVSFIIHNGYQPDSSKKKLIMHDCENPACVNPKHLLEGTPKKNGNYQGCVAKCRKNIKDRSWWGSSGERHPRWGMKHSEETKQKIKESAIKRGGWHKGFKRSEETKKRISLAARGENSKNAKLKETEVLEIYNCKDKQAAIARRYGVDPSIISLIKSRKAWKHLWSQE